MKAKDQYEQKKQEEKILKEEIKNQDNILGDILGFATNTKLRIEKMRKQWGYQFAKGQNQYDVVNDFKVYAELVSQKIVDELGLHNKKRYYQPI